jgi:hypothetical protein
MREKLKEYTSQAQDIIEEDPQMGERNTKQILIPKFIRTLGWEIRPDEVDTEYSVRIASKKTRVDFALLLEKTPVGFIEVKGVDTNLRDGHREQLTNYMHNEENVELGLLTNGRKYEFYMYDGSPSATKLDSVELERLPNKERVVKTMSKEAVVSEKFREIAQKLHERKKSVSELRDNKEDIAEDIVEVVTSRVGESVSDTVGTEAKELVDRVVNELDDEPDPPKPPEPPEPEDKEGDLVLTAGDTKIASFDGDNQSESMSKAVDYLVREYDLLDSVSIPYVPGDRKAILNDEPKHPDGEEMRVHKQISGGYYLDTHMNRNGKERELRRLAGMCGLDVDVNW